MLNVALLKKVKAHILEEPKRFFMEYWIHKDDPGSRVELDDIYRTIPPCGTAACIGGWAMILSGSDISSGFRYHVACGALDIPQTDQAEELFSVYEWPAKYAKEWHRTKSLRRRAEIAGRRIDAYIRKYGPKKHDK